MLVERVPLPRVVEELDDSKGRGLCARAVLSEAGRLLELEEGVDRGLGADLFFGFGCWGPVVLSGEEEGGFS